VLTSELVDREGFAAAAGYNLRTMDKLRFKAAKAPAGSRCRHEFADARANGIDTDGWVLGPCRVPAPAKVVATHSPLWRKSDAVEFGRQHPSQRRRPRKAVAA
jgi:hypothetical protein